MKWQQRKSFESRQRLLSATLACLERDGFHHLSLDRIAKEAGISKGALTHHYANKDELLVQAMAKSLNEFVIHLEDGAHAVHAGELDLDGFIDLMWQRMSDRLYMVTLEVILKARHEQGFKTTLAPLVQDFHCRIDAIWQQLLPEMPASQACLLMNLTANLLRGMGAQSVFRDDADYFTALLNTWKQMFKQYLSTPPAELPASDQMAQ